VPREPSPRSRWPAEVLAAAAAFGLDAGALRSLGGKSGSAWSDGQVVLRVGERVAAEVLAAEAAAARVPVPRVLRRADGAALLALLPGRPAGELARLRPERAEAAGRACAALQDRLSEVPAPPGLRAVGPGERLLHLDLHPFNVLVDDDGEPTGVIDWANAAAGPAELDRARTWSILTLDPAALALRADPGWRALSEHWLAGLGPISADARAWACRFMLSDLAGRHSPAELEHVSAALAAAES
jgi:Ser/Thr protein kinase RdoA (MazF antagonist)